LARWGPEYANSAAKQQGELESRVLILVAALLRNAIPLRSNGSTKKSRAMFA
jgi:hypothetical protein